MDGVSLSKESTRFVEKEKSLDFQIKTASSCFLYLCAHRQLWNK